MKRRFNKSLIIGLLVILIISTMANSLIFFYGDFGIAQADRAGSSPRPGPKELLKNNGFGMISDWAFQNASTDLGEHIWAKYDNELAPSVGKFESAQDLDTKTGIILYSYINQTFQKDITTPNYPTAVVCEFDWIMNAYHSEVDGSSRIDGEIFLQIVNNTPLSTPAQWGITGAWTFRDQSDSRIPDWQNAKINVGSSISPKGSYNLSIILRLTVPIGSQVDMFVCDLVIDNVSLRIADDVKPLVVANSHTFGPYNVAPGNAIDVDFFDGGLENVSLKVGSYRLNGSSTWNTIFTNNKTYTQNWSIGAIFDGAGAGFMLDGENTIDVYCADQVGNFNDSVHITIIKDSVAPLTNASELEEYYRVPEFNINYTASDAAPSGGYNNTVELWFEFNDGGSYQQYKPPEEPDGFFNQSPIVFDITKTG
ncbi:MAG: hypothetical protein KAJ51_01490, partial [Thermoplasmata archaeon]|nr:hypothetical protein [Thermoplasmata archaeon]